MDLLSKTMDQLFSLPIGNKTLTGNVYAEAVELIHDLCADICRYEQEGHTPEAIATLLTPLRIEHGRSPFIQRTQQWPRGYPGDYESIEYLLKGINQAPPNTLGYFFEEYALQAPVAQQHRNKLRYQAELILTVLSTQPEQEKKILALANNCSWDLRSIQHLITDAEVTFYLNDHDVEALDYVARELSDLQDKCRFIPGNFIRAMKTLAQDAPFHLITTGGVCDYLNDRQMGYLIEKAYHQLLAEGGILYLTNVAKGNPYRPWMEYLGGWTLIERDEADIQRIAQHVGCPQETISIRKEDCGLTLLIEIRK